jgi:hypothetical protein
MIRSSSGLGRLPDVVVPYFRVVVKLDTCRQTRNDIRARVEY